MQPPDAGLYTGIAGMQLPCLLYLGKEKGGSINGYIRKNTAAQKGKRLYPGGTGREAQCFQTVRFQMGIRSFPNKRILRNNLCLPACE